jgi:hypothetical protein
VDFDEYEHQIGYVRARLRVVAVEAGGPADGVRNGYRPNWGVGERLSGSVVADAPITVEDIDRIGPGETGLVRLHPIDWAAWAEVRPGQRIPMIEGARIVGIAELVEIVRY